LVEVLEKWPITIAMDIYVARQPIFNRFQKVIGYELLHRSGLTNSYDATDGTEASLAVISNTYLFLSQRVVAPPTQAFINLTRDLLLNGVAGLLPNKSTVIEILEDIEPDETVLKACQELKKAGYTLALDDYTIANEAQRSLLSLADIVKVDFAQSTREESQAIIQKFGNGRGKFLAEKVETLDEFKSALSMGYSFFQGYFFSKPVIVPGKAIPGYKLNYMRMLQETNKRELDFHALERIIKQDMTLCYTLLKYINSAYFGFRDEITSLLSAIVLLGEEEIRRWASLVLFTLMGVDKPPELVLRSLIRAQMCELLAADLGLKGHESELFLMGMFSMLDVLIGRPLAEILEGMNLGKEVKGALLGEENSYRDLYDLVVSYESGDWDTCFESASRINLDRKSIPENYLKAVYWAEEVVGIGSQKPK
jgi:c-di-GMP-related signal transduction protein